MPDEIDTDLQQAIQGLRYVSETNAPFEVVHWPNGTRLDASRVCQLSGHKAGDPVRITNVDEFFTPLTDYQAWFGAMEKAEAQKYCELRDVIRQRLSNPRVFRVGEIEIDIFVIGRSDQGDWAGVKTRAVET